MHVSISVNGEQVSREIEPRLLLVHFIRETPGLTGTHWGCDTSNCGACVVLMDGEPVKSCTILAAMCEGHEIRTVESLEVDGRLDPVQMGFHETHALQCGFCTPGMLMTARALLDENPDPTDHEIRTAISGAICRCTGYKNIVSAVRWAAEHEAAAETGGVSMTTVENLPSAHDRAPDRLRSPEAQGGRALHPRQGHATSTTSGCRGWSTARCCAARTRTRASSRSTPRGRSRTRTSRPSITAKDLETLGLAWMPTISYDTQAVLAGDKVRFQGQEVAFVIATDEYSANDALAADRRRVRAAAGDRQRPQGARPGRAADPRRQGRPARQPREPDLGGRRRGGDEPRVRRGRHDRGARHHLSALPSGPARDVRDDRRLQPGDRPARHLQRQPGAARAPHGLRARRRARRAHDPDQVLRTSAAASATRFRSIRATCARSPARSWPASRSSGSRTAPRTSSPPASRATTSCAARCARRTARSPACAST